MLINSFNFGSINCSSSTSLNGVCSIDYYQHVLHCAVDTKVDATSCTHSHDIGASCSIERTTSNPYKSQVALSNVGGQHHLSPSSGALTILFDKPNKPVLVCGEGFNKNATDTACRQLGHTNAITISTLHFRPQNRPSGMLQIPVT